MQQTTVGAVALIGAPNGVSSAASEAAATEALAGAVPGASVLVKLTESPFYPAGGGQVSDTGTIECASAVCLGRVTNVYRLGEDQALEVCIEQGSLAPEEPVLARVDHAARRATERNHTATHLLHAALRERLGGHVRQAGSYVGPDKLRFDFTHTGALAAQELRDVEDAVNAWIVAGDPVRAISTTLEEARRLGAMALFGEKYGEVVRMIQIGDGSYSRELCGGTHVRTTAEIGVFHIVSETSSAANVRRIEALTGAGAAKLLREHDRLLRELAVILRASPESVVEHVRMRERVLHEVEKLTGARAEQVPVQLRARMEPDGQGESALSGGVDAAALAAGAQAIADVPVVSGAVAVSDAKALLDLVDRVKGRLDGPGIVVLGTAVAGRVHLAVSVAPELVARGVKAGAVVKEAAAVVGGGGGGRDTLAQAGGRDPGKLDAALAVARAAIAQELGS